MNTLTPEQRNQRMRERYAATCIHFTGIGVDSCKAGISYDSFARPGLPCFPPLKAGMPAQTCPKFEAEGMDRLLAREAEADAYDRKVAVARKAIVAHMDEKQALGWLVHAGAIPCPVCVTGQLRFRIASNFHIAGTCSTEKCVAWIE